MEFGAARQSECLRDGIVGFGRRIDVVHVEKVSDTTKPRWGFPSGSRINQRVVPAVGRNKIWLSRTDSNRRQSG